MPAITSEETVLRIAANDAEPLNLRLDAGAPVAVRIDVQGTCTCRGGASVRPGSYTDTDFGKR
ncbi:hypothetical protein FHJ30_05255 [Arthrobacter sp. BB-1]|uniref:hypothetical protein n=1 Tax=unclassified Arthrobacter TaxID=235627 RepID=UPI0010DCB98D|nr:MULTISPECIES: hypothetical protein [unclassified Arthrobacter]TNB74595.1 hypothetical protein FHJ30_05255 [Arthrobacter sp. BB-1]VII94949.1 hypothetical protein [Arthrobacter sp. DR-2P]